MPVPKKGTALGTWKENTDDAALRHTGLEFEDDDPEAAVMPESTKPRVAAYFVAQDSMGNFLERTGDLHPLPSDCDSFPLSLENINAKRFAAGRSFFKPGHSEGMESISTRTISFPSEWSAPSKGSYLAEDEEAVLEIQVRELSSLPGGPYSAEDEEAVPQVQVREVSAQSDGIYPADSDEAVPQVQVGEMSDLTCPVEDEEAVAEVRIRVVPAQVDGTYLDEDEEAVPGVQVRSAQIAGVGQDIHVLPVTAMEVPSNSRNPFAATLPLLIKLHRTEPNTLCVFAGSGFVACIVVWWFLEIFAPPGAV